jgi:tripartite ATP-independent transporter DctM subunit
MIPLEWMPPLMFGGLIVFMLIGFPVAFSLMAAGLFFAGIAIAENFFGMPFLQAIPQRIFGSVLANDLLLAIPFFTFMGAILERCGLAEEMLDSMGQLFGGIRGGLGYSVIIVGFILGAITGTVAAQVIAMAMISLPVMMRYGYNMRYATGVLAASGTITQLVPPSLVLIVLADQLKTQSGSADVGSMYLGAWGPSLLQIGLFALYTFFLSRIRPDYLPAAPENELTLQGSELWKKCLMGIIPSAVLIFLVLGTIMTGIATPTESGAMGAMGALLLAWIRRASIPNLKALIQEAYQNTMRITAMVVFILIGSTCFSVVFQGVDGGHWVEELFSNLPGGWIGFLVVVNLFVFFLAFFLDFFEIAFIVIPMLAPVAVKLLSPVLLASMNGNPQAAASAALVWFGVMLCVNMQTSFMHPPFGFALFYLRGVAPKEVKSSDIYWGAFPWVVLQLIMVVLVAAFPALVTTFLDKPAAVAESQDFNFTGNDDAKPEALPNKVDEDAPVTFQLDKPGK